MRRIFITPEDVGKYIEIVDPEPTTTAPNTNQPSTTGPPPPAPSNTTTLFELDQVEDAQRNKYNQWVSDVRAAAPPRRHPRFQFDDGRWIEVSNKAEPPYMVGSNVHFEVRKPYRDPRGHCEWRPRHERLIEGSYLHQDREYGWQFEARLDTLQRVQAHPQTVVTFLQVWGPGSAYKAGHSRMPPLALQIYRGRWRIQSYGCDRMFDSKEDWQDNCHDFGSPDDLWHVWQVQYRPSSTDGLLRVSMDGHEVHRVNGVPTAFVPRSEIERGWAGQQRFGCYTSPTDEACRMVFRRFSLVEID